MRFDNWFANLFPNVARGDYWVLAVDDDYRTALVGNPNREYLWLLSRTRRFRSRPANVCWKKRAAAVTRWTS